MARARRCGNIGRIAAQGVSPFNFQNCNVLTSTASVIKADVVVSKQYPTTINDEKLTKRMLPVIERAADGKVSSGRLSGASEDFSFFAQEAPGLYLFLGVTPPDQDPAAAAPNHSPGFLIHEPALVIGVRTMASLAVSFLMAPPS